MPVIHLDPDVYIALAAHRDNLSHTRDREVRFDDTIADLLDRFRSDTRPAAPKAARGTDAPRATATAAVTARATAAATR